MGKSEDGKTAVKLKMSRGAFSVGGDFGRAVNFSVASVPDSLLQQGAFAKHFERGALVGELVTIEPSAEVEIVGGMAVDIPILDHGPLWQYSPRSPLSPRCPCSRGLGSSMLSVTSM